MAGKRGRGRGGKGGGNGRAVAAKISVELPPGVEPQPSVELPPRVTREANKTAHPGLLDAKQPRRTAAEMEEARAAEAAQDAAKEQQRQAALQKVAAKEDAMRREDARRALEAFTGPATPQAVSQPKAETTGTSAEVPSSAEDSDVVMLDGSSDSASEVVSSPDSDAYVPQPEAEVEASVAKAKTKKQHKKSTREDVRTQRQTSDEPPVSSIVAAGDKSNKRKAAGVADHLPAKKSKKAPPKPGGIDTKALKEVKDAADHTKKTNDDSMVRAGGFAEDD
ncbi:uncharacterized protein SCHCODRAFT_02531559, partial [Schizophyllum commune H4-8]|uniref:uncharacterized protein n=1 Tax=Schizophyllum commune (strain H4-8 / FGSC 9210) TaxID=578458 RepID=UPI00215E1E49